MMLAHPTSLNSNLYSFTPMTVLQAPWEPLSYSSPNPHIRHPIYKLINWNGHTLIQTIFPNSDTIISWNNNALWVQNSLNGHIHLQVS